MNLTFKITDFLKILIIFHLLLYSGSFYYNCIPSICHIPWGMLGFFGCVFAGLIPKTPTILCSSATLLTNMACNFIFNCLQLCIAVPCHIFKFWAFIGIMFQVKSIPTSILVFQLIQKLSLFIGTNRLNMLFCGSGSLGLDHKLPAS